MSKKKQLKEQDIKNVNGGFDYRKLKNGGAIYGTRQDEATPQSLPIIGESNSNNSNENDKVVFEN